MQFWFTEFFVNLILLCLLLKILENMIVYNAYNQIAELTATLNPTEVMGLKADSRTTNPF